MEHLFDAPAGMPAEEPVVAPPRGQLREQTADRLYDLLRASPPLRPSQISQSRRVFAEEVARIDRPWAHAASGLRAEARVLAASLIGRRNAEFADTGLRPTTWTTAEGQNIRLVDMSEDHLYNAWAMVQRRRREAFVANQSGASRILEVWARAFERERDRRRNANRST